MIVVYGFKIDLEQIFYTQGTKVIYFLEMYYAMWQYVYERNKINLLFLPTNPLYKVIIGEALICYYYYYYYFILLSCTIMCR